MTAADVDTTLERMTLQWSVQDFYYTEALLLDERRYDEWLELWSTDATYWAPVRLTREGYPDRSQPGELGVFEDDFGSLALRVEGMKARSAWAETPPSRTVRVVTNVRAAHLEDRFVNADSNVVIHRSRLEAVDHTFVCQRHDRLEQLPDGTWRLWDRQVLVNHSSFTTDNISVIF